MESEEFAIRVVMWVTLGLSCLGSCFISFVYLYFRDIRSFPFKLVFYMSLADIGHAIGFFLPGSPNTMCEIQAIITSYCSLSSVLWTAAIAYTIYQATVRQIEDISMLEVKLLIFAYGLPLLALVPPLVEGTYGEAQGWCWIVASGSVYWKGNFWRVVTFYGPLWLVICYNLFAYFSVIHYLKETTLEYNLEVSVSGRVVRKLRLYPLVLIACYVLATVNRIYNMFYPNEMCFELTIVAAGVMCLCGLANAFIYGFTDTVRKRLKEWVLGDESTGGDLQKPLRSSA